jgi:three-Cys-motif partner protein
MAKSDSTGKAHRFGGDWTASKLSVLASYLNSYTQALKNKPSAHRPFRKSYIDAFAGTGYRTQREEKVGETSSTLLLPDLAEREPQAFLDGSASLALKTSPPFDSYVFIERSPDRCYQLELLKADFPHLATKIEIRQGDANAELKDLCNNDWRSQRAVLFIDPYGMQVDWQTIEAIAGTKAIDLWLLFPLGIGVNRLLTRSGEIPESWRRRLNILLGTENWYEEFYRVEATPTLFGGSEERIVKATTETIGRYFNDRLRSIFAGVANEPKILRNSANCPLYLLCFAVGNENGAPIALRIANHLLTKGMK